jgi:ectoine hydroxylase-related dioxygenase (phytanoyl-CoA dioxygenase family)
MSQYTPGVPLDAVGQEALLRDGYIVVEDIIRPEQLADLRAAFETMVERQRAIWITERDTNDPPGGAWDTGAQPRVVGFDRHVDGPQTATALAWCLDAGGPLEASQRIMQTTAAPTAYMLMCNPQKDHGPAAWHRDIHPIDQAPLSALEQDLLANGPGYLQWNIALYDDDVLQVVPGSHRRPNTAAENAQLHRDNRAPLPGALQVRLKAGDGVVYTNTILHWGSQYNAKLRRTVHLGYRALGGRLFPYVPGLHRGGDATLYLSPHLQRLVQNHQQLYLEECDRVEAVYRAMMAKDADAFYASIAALHPGPDERIVTAVLLSKVAYKLHHGDHPQRPGYCGDWTQEPELGPRFSAAERALLWQRFAWLDAQLQTTEEQFTPGFQSGPMSYLFEEMPAHLSLEAVVENW